MPALYPDYLENEVAYARAQTYWSDLWRGVLNNSDASHVWKTPWLPDTVRDGNPIFTAVCSSCGRGVRIIHEGPAQEGENDLDWWIDEVEGVMEGSTIRELVIACCPSGQNQTTLETLLLRWLQEGKVPDAREG